MGVNEGKDVLAAVHFVRENLPNVPVIGIGSSMGAASLITASAEDPKALDALVLDGAYGRFTAATLGWWRFLGGKILQFLFAPIVLVAWPLAGFNPFKVDMAENLRKIGPKPLLFIHGTRDSLALPSEATRNFEAAIGPKTLVWMEGYGHAEGRWEEPTFYNAKLDAFLKEVLASSSPVA